MTYLIVVIAPYASGMTMPFDHCRLRRLSVNRILREKSICNKLKILKLKKSCANKGTIQDYFQIRQIHQIKKLILCQRKEKQKEM